MDLNEKIQDLFITKDAPNKPRDTNSALELKSIEHKMNLHLKNKQGLKYQKVNFTHDKFYDEGKFSEVIDDEIKSKTANKKWKGLPMFLKWQYLTAYFTDQNITDQNYISNIKKLLMSNKLDVEYEDQKVKHINV
jgi:hypothetical protein